ncbi:MAG: polysaccharide deacetylase family protein [Candidatus Kerfeldbacteria bacterium]|nr:polysaccharide deacetylase family protein [Candidatus Kerfeldbacteria bacterium]
MANYRRYQPYRQHRTSGGGRLFKLVGWAAVGIVVIILIRNGLSGSSTTNQNASDSIRLANNSNGNLSVNATASTTVPELSGRELITKDCPKPISLARVDGKYVALTLDGGGIIGDALKALDVIKSKQVPATLFSTGKWAEDNAEVIKAYHDAGVDIFSHSYSHPSFKGLDDEKVDTELTKAEAAVFDVTTETTKPYFRPPFGDYDTASLAETRKQGYCMILWTVDAEDWKNGATADSAKTRVLDGLKDGAIMMLQANSDIAVDLLGPLVDEVRAKGYTFVTLRDLLRVETSAASQNTNSSAGI